MLSFDTEPQASREFVILNKGEKNRWLYDLLFTQADRTAKPKETFKSFKVHLDDSYSYYPHPTFLQSQKLRSLGPASIVKGSMGYVSNIFKKGYTYNIYKKPDGEFVMAVRVHLRNATPADYKAFQAKMKQAEQVWNGRRTQLDFKYSFLFDITNDPKNAHYSVQVTDSTRGPYDTFWGRNWSFTTIAHELGHMMGLGDEYETLTGRVDCMTRSLMCSSNNGLLMPHHYYFVLRRMVQPPQ